MTKPDDIASTPNRVPWPPLLLGASLLGAVLMNQLVPLNVGRQSPEIAIGLLVAAFGLDAWVFEIFRRHNTEIMPHKPARVLVTEGPFRWSRNPIYVGNVLIIFGGAALTGSLWFLVAAAVFVVAVTRLAILREERHLAALFGGAWEEYRARVRRWL
ncbi:MAG: isoprenylcysteine carboxylmethyltransferase family protein [Pseudomonadota bacterium]